MKHETGRHAGRTAGRLIQAGVAQRLLVLLLLFTTLVSFAGAEETTGWVYDADAKNRQ